MTQTVLFICPHGAGKSRLAAAWFNSDPPTGWRAATAAGESPAPHAHPGLTALLAGTAAEPHVDQTPPARLPADLNADIIVAIDCNLPATHQWQLRNTHIDNAACEELRERVLRLTGAIRAKLQATND